MTIKFSRTEPGWYYANNGRDILDPNYLSVEIIQNKELRRWETSYYSMATTVPVCEVYDEYLEWAKVGVRAVFADDVASSHIRYAHPDAVTAAIVAKNAEIRATLG